MHWDLLGAILTGGGIDSSGIVSICDIQHGMVHLERWVCVFEKAFCLVVNPFLLPFRSFVGSFVEKKSLLCAAERLSKRWI